MEVAPHRQTGFTLIEMLVALALFSVVVTIAVGSLLSLIDTNRQLQTEQEIMTNLSFALDSMTREIRTGTTYYCSGRPNYSAGGPNSIFNSSNDMDVILGDAATGEVQDCNSSGSSVQNMNLQGVAFVESGDSITGSTQDRILYYFDGTDSDNKTLYRRVGDGPSERIVSSNIEVVDANFFVSGTDPTDDIQPSVTIFIEAKPANDSTSKTYTMQTTVTQRSLDI